MAKKYAPETPDAKWHRPGDTAYLRELLEAAGLSQRAAGPRLGFDERSMRYKVAGEKPLSYTEQYCLEVLADARRKEMNAVHEPMLEYGARPPATSARVGTVWYDTASRPLSKRDAGKIVLGKDKYGATICGTLTNDEFGMFIRELHPQPVDAHNVPIDRVIIYTLLDPPPKK